MDAMRQIVTWLGMADEARKAALRLSDHELRRHLLAVADSYEAIAARAEALTVRVAMPANSNERRSA